MRDFLIAICPVAIWCIVAGETALAVLLFKDAKKAGQPISFCSAVLTVGLILDATIIGLGTMLSAQILETISPIRFVAHGLLIPLLFPICAYSVDLKKPGMIGVWAVTLVLMAAGAAQAFQTVLELREIAGVIRYASGDGTPQWANAISRLLSFGTVIPMMIVGILVWIKQKTAYLFLSGFLMFVFSALGPATGNADLIFFISMFGELLMVLFLYFYARAKSAGVKKE